MIKDWNREDFSDEVFTFKNSTTPFIYVETSSCEPMFINLHGQQALTFDEIQMEDFEFYRKDEDEDFMGVNVIGYFKINK